MVSQKDGAIIGIGALILLGGGLVGKKVLGGLTGGSSGGGSSGGAGETLAEDTQLPPIYNDYRTYIDETGEDSTTSGQSSIIERTITRTTTTSSVSQTAPPKNTTWPRHKEGDPIASTEESGVWPLAKNPWGVNPWPTDDGDPVYVPPPEPKKLALILPASQWVDWYTPEDSN